MLSVTVPKESDVKSAEEAFKRFHVQDGDVITVASICRTAIGPFTSRGMFSVPGKYPYKDGAKLTDLIASFDDLLPEPADRAEIIPVAFRRTTGQW